MKTVSVTLWNGFGNQMGQYAFARGYAERIGAELHLSGGTLLEKVFTIKHPTPTGDTMPTKWDYEFPAWDGQSEIHLAGDGLSQNVMFYTKADCKRWFTFRPEILEKLSAIKPYEIAAHLRWGDYVGLRYFTPIPRESYWRCCDENGLDRKKLVFFSADHPLALAATLTLAGLDPFLDFLPDFWALATADVLIRAPSSFSYWAGVIGTNKRIFCPDLKPEHGDGQFHDVNFVQGNHTTLRPDYPRITDLHLK